MRKYTIGAIAGLVAALVFSSVASADVTAVSVDKSSITPSKQDRKVRGPASFFFQSDDSHAGADPCPIGTANTLGCVAYPPSRRSVITFPSDFRFDAGNLVDCNLSALVGKGVAAAKAACPRSLIGGGTITQRFSDGRILFGTLTAFNGAESGGLDTQYYHIDIPGVETKPIISTVIRGTVIDAAIPPIAGSVIDSFDVTVNRIVTGKKKNKKTGRVEKKYYFSARCSKGSWVIREDVTYEAGRSLSDETSIKCTKKKKK